MWEKRNWSQYLNFIDNLVTTNSFQVYKLWDFEVYKIREGGTYRMFVDDKNRNLLIQDFVFQFIN